MLPTLSTGYEMQIDEKACAQFPMIRHAAEVGWLPVDPEAAKTKRGGASSMLFKGELAAKLAQSIPGSRRTRSSP